MFLCSFSIIILSALTQFIDYILDDTPADVADHLTRQRRIFTHLSLFGRKIGDLSEIMLGAVRYSLQGFQAEIQTSSGMHNVGWQELTKWHLRLAELMPVLPVTQQTEAGMLLKDLDRALDGVVKDEKDKAV
jgi:hypothetical protein